jgi:DNA-binding NtrC family response regulator
VAEIPGRVLIVDDEPEILQALACVVRHAGLIPLLAQNGIDALHMVRTEAPDLLLTDFKMPNMDGIALLNNAKREDPDLPVILLTGYADVPGAVEAMRAGAHDYLSKPFDHGEVLRVVLRALHERRIKQDLKVVLGSAGGAVSLRDTFGPSESIGRLIVGIKQVAKSDFSVVIAGETGAGKEVVARVIHHASERAGGPFIAVDCGAIPEALLESELFGHERGAFTGAASSKAGKLELARGGTLFLDELPNMPLASQAKLLRVLQERTMYRLGGTAPLTVDVRVLVATNRDLRDLCDRGLFRRDLYFRLNEFSLSIPPLRKRREDILFLGKRFMEIVSVELAKRVEGFSPDATEAMLNYDWPGNVRQLRSVIRRAVLVSDGYVRASDLDLGKWHDSSMAIDSAGEQGVLVEGEVLTLREIVRRNTCHVERKVIFDALVKTGGNKARAARMLHVDYKTLHSKVKEYGIQTEGAYEDVQ